MIGLQICYTYNILRTFSLIVWSIFVSIFSIFHALIFSIFSLKKSDIYRIYINDIYQWYILYHANPNVPLLQFADWSLPQMHGHFNSPRLFTVDSGPPNASMKTFSACHFVVLSTASEYWIHVASSYGASCVNQLQIEFLHCALFW